MMPTYVTKTYPDSVRVYALSDVLSKGLEAACPVWISCRTKKAFASYVDDYTTCDGYAYDSRNRARRINPTLCDDCVLCVWRGSRLDRWEEGEPLIQKEWTGFDDAWFSTADYCVTYGDKFSLAHSDELQIGYVKERGDAADDETEIELRDIPEFHPTVAQFEEATGYRFNKAMSGKMSGIMCASTSNLCNPFCAARKGNPDMICAACFADSTCKQYEALRENMARNTEIITARLFEDWELPELPGPLFRFESFGDLRNVTQARNYIRMARVNPGVACALWTKNPGFLAQAVALEGGRPDNLITIHSSAYIDTPAPVDRFPGLFDKTFTVYRPETVAARQIDINCGARDCMTCRRCYSRTTESDVRELLK